MTIQRSERTSVSDRTKPGARGAAALMALAALAGSVHAQQASFQGLGHLPSSLTEWSEAHGVSADGQIVTGFVRTADSLWASEAFVWTTAGGMVSVGKPASPDGSNSALAKAISGDGQVLVGDTDFEIVGGNTGYTVTRPSGFMWTNGGGFVRLEPVPMNFRAQTHAVNWDGSYSAGISHAGGGFIWVPALSEAVRWDRGQPQTLGLHPGGPGSEALGISADGQTVVGECGRPDEEGQAAFKWTPGGGLIVLPDLPGGWDYSSAKAASADGGVIVGYGVPDFAIVGFGLNTRAVRWTSAGIEQLLELAGTHGSEATAISPDGSIVVGWAAAPVDRHPIIWDAVHGARDIVDIMTAAGVDMSDWTFMTPTGVSADGHVVVGSARRVSAGLAMEAWRAYLP